MRLLFTNDWLRNKIASDPDDEPSAGDLYGELDMSYSFTITAGTKEAVGGLVAAKLADIVLAQPSHAADKRQAQEATEAFVAILADPGDGECIKVSVSGSLGWRGPDTFTSASINVSAYLAPKD